MEELRLILETVKGVSDSAATIAMLWIIKDIVIPLVAPVAIISTLGYFAKKLFGDFLSQSAKLAIIAGAAGMSTPLYSGEIRNICRCLEKHFQHGEYDGE